MEWGNGVHKRPHQRRNLRLCLECGRNPETELQTAVIWKFAAPKETSRDAIARPTRRR
jgi:hypothetical protein